MRRASHIAGVMHTVVLVPPQLETSTITMCVERCAWRTGVSRTGDGGGPEDEVEVFDSPDPNARRAVRVRWDLNSVFHCVSQSFHQQAGSVIYGLRLEEGICSDGQRFAGQWA